MQNAYTLALARVPWQLFGTLTFSREGTGPRLRETMFFAWLRQAAKCVGVPFRKVLWCRRTELGELGGRLHFHCLIGRLPKQRVHPGLCFQLMRRWEGVGGGFARVRVFDSELEGPEYLLKALSGSDAYESAKTVGGRSDLMLSRSLLEVVSIGCELDRESFRECTSPAIG